MELVLLSCRNCLAPIFSESVQLGKNIAGVLKV